MQKTILFLLVIIGCFSSCKKEEVAEKSLSGDYFGLLISKLYQSFNGQTTIDTLDSNLKVNLLYNSAAKTLQLTSPNTLLNGLTLNEIDITDSTNAHYGNEKYFEYTATTPVLRYYYLHYNRVSGKDSIWLQTYLPPSGGWNLQEIYTAVK